MRRNLRIPVFSQRSAQIDGRISERFSMMARVFWIPSASSPVDSSSRERFCTSSSSPWSSTRALTSVSTASSASSAVSGSVNSFSRAITPMLMSVFSWDRRPNREVTAPSFTKSGKSSGAAATAKSCLISESRATSLSRNLAGSSTYLTRSCWFRLIFFSKETSMVFSDARSSSKSISAVMPRSCSSCSSMAAASRGFCPPPARPPPLASLACRSPSPSSSSDPRPRLRPLPSL
mmetsp:Transcript_23593/g.69030  ORF Transcript_23593/g.69030 Transcript_23593/m.69030 type:complete len:234 (+) Transcript_23593:1242-1943(+)